MPTLPTRRAVLTGTLALAAAAAAPQAVAQDKVIKMGSLKLIHSIAPHFYEKFTPAGYKVEIIPFDSPTDGKNAVVTGSGDFGLFGLGAATIRGAAGGRPGGGGRARDTRAVGGGRGRWPRPPPQ